MYAKAIAAISAALGVALSVTVDGTVSLNDAIAIVAAAVGALAVYTVPNATKG